MDLDYADHPRTSSGKGAAIPWKLLLLFTPLLEVCEELLKHVTTELFSLD